VFIPATFYGTFQAAFTGTDGNPVKGEIALSDAQMLKLFGEWLKEHPDWVPPSQPEPAPPAPPEPQPGQEGIAWNVPCDSGFPAKVMALWDERKPAILGPGTATFSTPLILDSVMGFAGQGIRHTTLIYNGQGPAFKSPTSVPSVTQSWFRDFRIERPNQADDIFYFIGFSNGSTMHRIDMRGGKHQIHLTPAISDASSAWRGHMETLFAFSAGGSVIRVDDGGRGKRSNLLLSAYDLDIGRCNGPIISVNKVQETASTLSVRDFNLHSDKAPDGSPNARAVEFIGCGAMPVTFDTGWANLTGSGRSTIYADSPISLAVKNMNVKQNPLNNQFPEWAVNTPALKVAGTDNDGVINC